tara:strand:- start:309 stop:551 length:243 start_codon:yes stop_codon:yes gene_type:complete
MKNLEKQAMEIVAQLFDLAEVPVDKRQEINDVAYDYVTEQLIITDVGVPKGTFNCGQERVYNEKRCSKQCDTCIEEYRDN